MKTRVLFILLSVLFIIPVNAIPHKRHRHKVNAKIISSNYKVNTRSPLFFNLTADEVDDNLTITFQSVLEETDITVTDKNGNIIASELNSSIYEGKTVNIYAPESDIYTIEITSPIIDVTAEITLNEI
ncbi:hypothetical protein DWW10_07895 [Bacteroides intestinalis]|jgi:hypothetical protein|uniref:DUF3244 domain-containing protein n=1 Tax=Bacteroides intestinalis TaxID=329854 RepID=A0A412YD51_9BACE|nr:hypothetical protein [Bacteroides intestinalis]RGV55449.1 hypothetical protein DWW10_07895 [Bacteroides intestinalis]RHA60410.1 hypothetical protein DW932_10500 [Bacteroides intestinalis]